MEGLPICGHFLQTQWYPIFSSQGVVIAIKDFKCCFRHDIMHATIQGLYSDMYPLSPLDSSLIFFFTLSLLSKHLLNHNLVILS